MLLPFRDRQEAGKLLASRLLHLKNRRPVVLALPRGGVPIGAAIAAALEAPLDLLMVRKIGHPLQPELAIGAITNGDQPEFVTTQDLAHFDIPASYIREEAGRQLAVIAERRKRYLGDRSRPTLAGRLVIVVDDGIATGATARAALRATRHANPSCLVLAVPVAAADSLAALRQDADDVVCLATPTPFIAIGNFYRDFPQVSDNEVVQLLDAAAGRLAGPKFPDVP